MERGCRADRHGRGSVSRSLGWLGCGASALLAALLVGCPLDIDETFGSNATTDDASLDDVADGSGLEGTAGDGTRRDASARDAQDDSGDLVGCALTTTQDAEAMDGGMGIECPGNETPSAGIDGGIRNSHVGKLPGRLLAGQAYSFAYDRVLPINLGQPVTVDVYGSNAPDTCDEGEKLFTMVLDGSVLSWNQSYCFTPKKSYAYIVSNVSVTGVLYYNSTSFAGTICRGCE